MPKYITINKSEVEKLWKNGFTIFKISQLMNVSRYAVSKTLLSCNMSPNKYIHKHTEETKSQLSIIRKKFLKSHPDEHPWRKNTKFKSVPCEKLKEWLRSKNVEFVSEYNKHGVTGRFFSIDIALPEKMIAIEVNGNQHYEKNGDLKKYYKEREQLLIKKGWSVYQIHYTMCFRIEKIEKLFKELVLPEGFEPSTSNV